MNMRRVVSTILFRFVKFQLYKKLGLILLRKLSHNSGMEVVFVFLSITLTMQGYYAPRPTSRDCVTSSSTSKRWIVGDNCELFDNSMENVLFSIKQ